ncbi:MAG: TetR/AcrR family transcriptional regulator [Kangiellaceae bacterium]|nr:TetR/AcrR family transcriptional regulator [Kangiellaceae bacterium]
MKPQKEIIREANEEKILQAAEMVFANYGFKGATTEKIANEAGLPKANLHYYFKTKSLLYRTVLEKILEEWMQAALVFDKYSEPSIAITHYVKSKMEFSRNRPFASKVWANEVIHGAGVVSEFLETTLTNWLNDRIEVINKWSKQRLINNVDPQAFFFMVWAMTQHYADFEKQIQILNKGKPYSDKDFDKKKEQVTALVLASVGLNT